MDEKLKVVVLLETENCNNWFSASSLLLLIFEYKCDVFKWNKRKQKIVVYLFVFFYDKVNLNLIAFFLFDVLKYKFVIKSKVAIKIKFLFKDFSVFWNLFLHWLINFLREVFLKIERFYWRIRMLFELPFAVGIRVLFPSRIEFVFIAFISASLFDTNSGIPKINLKLQIFNRQFLLC